MKNSPEEGIPPSQEVVNVYPLPIHLECPAEPCGSESALRKKKEALGLATEVFEFEKNSQV